MKRASRRICPLSIGASSAPGGLNRICNTLNLTSNLQQDHKVTKPLI